MVRLCGRGAVDVRSDRAQRRCRVRGHAHLAVDGQHRVGVDRDEQPGHYSTQVTCTRAPGVCTTRVPVSCVCRRLVVLLNPAVGTYGTLAVRTRYGTLEACDAYPTHVQYSSYTSACPTGASCRAPLVHTARRLAREAHAYSWEAPGRTCQHSDSVLIRV